MSANDNKVEFRLAPTFLKMLEQLGQKQGLTRNKVAEKLVAEALLRESVTQELETMNGQFTRLRKELAETVSALLIEVAGRKPDEVRNFMQKRFLKG